MTAAALQVAVLERNKAFNSLSSPLESSLDPVAIMPCHHHITQALQEYKAKLAGSSGLVRPFATAAL